MNISQSDVGSIKIVLSYAEDLRADSYEIKEDGIHFHLANAQPELLKHRFHNGQKPRFWTNYGDVHRRRAAGTLRCLADAVIDWSGDISRERPVYIIKDEETYRQFQSDIRQRSFVGDYAADSIQPVSRMYDDLRDIKSSHIKVWHNTRDGTASISVPLCRGSDNATVEEELLCSWLELERGASKVKSDKLRIFLKSARPEKTKRSFTMTGHAATPVTHSEDGRPKLSKVATWSNETYAEAMEVEREEAPSTFTSADFRAKLDEIDITFKDVNVRNQFLETIKPFVSTASTASSSSSRPDSLLEQGSSRPSSVLSRDGTSSAGYHTPASRSPQPGSGSFSPLESTSPTRAGSTDRDSDPGRLYHSPPFQQRAHGNLPIRESPSQPPRSPRVGTQTAHSYTELPAQRYAGHSSTPLSQHALAQRKRFWERQLKTALIADNARERARQNRIFYVKQFHNANEIRLLKIMPGNTEKIYLQSDIFLLSDIENEYEALSYAWGPGKTTREVVLNKRPGFVVSAHLEAALRRLRLPDRPRVVWIDAICINQMDVEEMNHQVDLMGSIYQHAKRTIIWIGELTPGTTTCERIYAAEDDPHSVRTLCANKASARDHFNNLDATLSKLLRDFFKDLELSRTHNAWHLRLWCVQEFHFSKALPSVYIGAHAIGWVHFEAIFQKAVGQHASLDLFRQLRDEPQTMHTLCTLTGSFKVSNPRDRIYSLLHMTKDHPQKIKAEYQRSILEVFEDATLYCIHESKSVDVLLDRRLDRLRGDGFDDGVLPSYIPDFTQLQPRATTVGNVEYCTGDDTDPVVSLCHDEFSEHDIPELENATLPRLLSMEAKHFDTIEYRTTIDDIPDHESSPSGELIYNSFLNPGALLKAILEALHFRFEPNMSRWNLNRSPKLGRLILEYLLEETRNYGDEMDLCTTPVGTDLETLYQREKKRDRKYITTVHSPDPENDSRFIGDHWRRRTTYIDDDDNTSLDIMKMLDHEISPWDQALHCEEATRTELQAAIEFENLFCYARKTAGKYYFSGQQYHRPMRKDILTLANGADVHGLKTQASDPDDEIEPHEYKEKARNQDFFCTKSGFVGLGPSTLEEGDEIVVPYGASRPFILRRCMDSATETYTLVGEAIVPGIMHGEWMASRHRSGRSWQLK